MPAHADRSTVNLDVASFSGEPRFVHVDETGRVYLRIEDVDRLKRIEDKLDLVIGLLWARQGLQPSPSPPLP